MSNAAGKRPSREEEIAFLAMEHVLGVEIELADAGTGAGQPDGAWSYLDDQSRRAIVEITSPPDADLMSKWAQAKTRGQLRSESGSIPLRWGELAEFFSEMLSADWARGNFEKLLSKPATERHLFLFGRSYGVQSYFYRLSDSYANGPVEEVNDLILPGGISDVWFEGRARKNAQQPFGSMTILLARYQASSGWKRHEVHIEEHQLPPPNPSIADDPVPATWRRPKDRKISSWTH